MQPISSEERTAIMPLSERTTADREGTNKMKSAAAAIVTRNVEPMNANGNQLKSGFPPSSNRFEQPLPTLASEAMPAVGKYDPEYDVAASARCFHAHAQLILETAEASGVIERPTFSNYLSHVRELLLYTLGWLEERVSSGARPEAEPVAELVRHVMRRARTSTVTSAEGLIALGLCFDELAEALDSL
ncbi:MAG TPA: hypothetical protein VGL13_11085 [Polyangiaceae bacterium]